MGSVLRRIFPLSKSRKQFLAMRTRRRDRPVLRTRQGLALVFGVALLVGLVWILVYYAWYLPLEKALQ